MLFGLDPQLLETRRMLLQSAGFEVVAVSSVEQLQSTDAPVQLVVLCHTLHAADCERALSIAATRWPDAKELILAPLGGKSDCAEHHEHKEAFLTIEGPARLIARLHELEPTPAFAA